MKTTNKNGINIDTNNLSLNKLKAIGSKYKETKILKLSEIYMPSDAEHKTLNLARSKTGMSNKHISNLMVSFRDNVDQSARLPMVAKCNIVIDDITYKYRALTGFHRNTCFKLLELDEWAYDVYELNQDGIGEKPSELILQIQENDHNPALPSSNDDIANAIIILITDGNIDRNRDAVKQYILDMFPEKHGRTKNAILELVLANPAVSDAKMWDDISLNEFFIKNNLTNGGELNKSTMKAGWTIKDNNGGSIPTYMMNAMKKYHTTGIESSFVLYTTKNPTETVSINDRRMRQLNEVEVIQNSIKSTCRYYIENGKYPWEINGFMPQDKINDPSLNSLLSVDDVVALDNKKMFNGLISLGTSGHFK